LSRLVRGQRLRARIKVDAENIEQLRILVADDHALMRRGIRVMLDSQRGWTVVGEAVTGIEAVEQRKD